MDISVIVPAYNVESYISNCIDSLLNQTFKGEYEIIVVNDGSTDKTANILSKYKNNGIVKIINQNNKGLSGARNTGIENSTGKYLLFIDGDDTVSSKLLEMAFSNIKESDLLIFGIEERNENNELISFDKPKKNQTIDENVFWNHFYYDHPVICTTACTKLYSKKIFEDLKFPCGKIHEDVYLLHFIISKCKKITLLSSSLYYYLRRKGSITTKISNKNALDIFDAYFSRLDYFYKKNNLKNFNNQMLSMFSQLRYYNISNCIEKETIDSLEIALTNKIKEYSIKNIKLPHYCKVFFKNKSKCYRLVLYKCRFKKLLGYFKYKRT